MKNDDTDHIDMNLTQLERLETDLKQIYDDDITN